MSPTHLSPALSAAPLLPAPPLPILAHLLFLHPPPSIACPFVAFSSVAHPFVTRPLCLAPLCHSPIYHLTLCYPPLAHPSGDCLSSSKPSVAHLFITYQSSANQSYTNKKLKGYIKVGQAKMSRGRASQRFERTKTTFEVTCCGKSGVKVGWKYDKQGCPEADPQKR